MIIVMWAALAMGQACVELRRSFSAGDLPLRAELQPSRCLKESRPGFVYDKHLGFVRAARKLQAGEIVFAPNQEGLADVRPGDFVQTLIKIGPVQVARSVQASQPARFGQKLFVRTEDGKMFAAQLAEAQQ